ncbi:hypothetical protein VPNG_06332 [Cytospora leucostoma]|uniref:DUF155 domain-containing protein n=1 Tax=Cytospora leucostoma TaxID=1230097 RepID=A0A423X287_9PEZI|nr:hypothetical protein VPNG_06332 [Cytospora leucostoma]
MRCTAQREVAAALCRGVQTSSRAATPRRPLQTYSLHQTSSSPAFRPPHRSFFSTSSCLLAKDGNGSDDGPSSFSNSPSSSSAAEQRPDQSQSQSPSRATNNSKKKAVPTAAAAKPPVVAKKSLSNPLRRVVNIAQRPDRKPSTVKDAKDGEVGTEQVEDDGRSQIRAICVAESFDMDAVVKILTDHWYQLDPDGLGFDTVDVVHARGSGGEGDVFIFPSGTVVTWSLPAEVGISMATGMLSKAALNANLESAERESLEFETDDSMSTSTMRRDKVVLGTKAPLEDGGDGTYPTLAKIAFSSGLARSTKIAFLEALLSAYFKKTKDIPMQLEAGRLAVTKKFILQRTGELLNLRSQLNLYSELTDSLPDMFWDQSSELRLENNYDQVGRALDVLDRIKLLNQRMDYAQEMATVMREMSDSDHSAYLEKIIIVLIMIEVCFELRRIFTEYQEAWKKEAEEKALEGIQS